jgi:hypothetical protein
MQNSGATSALPNPRITAHAMQTQPALREGGRAACPPGASPISGMNSTFESRLSRILAQIQIQKLHKQAAAKGFSGCTNAL